jgi:hypothetical protein
MGISHGKGGQPRTFYPNRIKKICGLLDNTHWKSGRLRRQVRCVTAVWLLCLHRFHFKCFLTYLELDSSRIRIQVKVKLSLCLTKHHAMKTYWEWRYSSTHSLTSALDGGEWSASHPGRFIPRERAARTHSIGGWVSPKSCLDTVSKGKFPSPRRESNPDHPLVQPVASRYTRNTELTFRYVNHKGDSILEL